MGSDSIAQVLLFGLAPVIAGAQALGFEAQKSPQSVADVVALGFGRADLGFFHPAALLQPR